MRLLLAPVLLLSSTLLFGYLRAEETTDRTAEEIAALQERCRQEFESFYTKIERIAEKLQESEPQRADLCREAIKYIRDKMVPDSFRRMNEYVRDKKLNLALDESSKLIMLLAEVLAILEGSGNIDKRLENLREYISRIGELIARQSELLNSTANNDKPMAEIEAPQHSLSLDTSELGARMEHDAFPESGSKVKEASGSMTSAADSLREGKRPDAQKNQSEALDKLKDALEMAKNTERILEAIKRAKRLNELKKIFEELAKAQREVLDSTIGVQSTFAEEGTLTRALKLKLTAAATSQKGLNESYDIINGGMDKEDGGGVFSYLMSKIVDDAAIAHGNLDSQKFGPETQNPQHAIISRLEAMIRGIEELLKPGSEEDGGGGGGGGGGSNQVVLPLAQLVALKAEQEDINLRLQTELSKGAKADKEVLKVLQQRQQECADLLIKMLEQAQ